MERLGRSTVSTRRMRVLRGAFSWLQVLGLMAVLLLCGTGHVAAQEDRETEERTDPVLDISEDDKENEGSRSDGRSLLDIDFPPVRDDGIEQQPDRSDGADPETDSSDSDLRRIVRQLQHDFTMLKEEIAQLRSEIRSIMPETPQEQTDTGETVNPFWISDAEIKKKESG